MVMKAVPIFVVHAKVEVLHTDEIVSIFGGVTL